MPAAQLPRGLSQATLHCAGRRLLDLKTGEWIRTFVIITTDANTLVADIHDRMPVILAPSDYTRWLGDEPDPHELIRPFPSEAMRMWPISTRVNKPENDDATILDPVEPGADAA
jgi:putative SOS response-associated peptidase YedK